MAELVLSGAQHLFDGLLWLPFNRHQVGYLQAEPLDTGAFYPVVGHPTHFVTAEAVQNLGADAVITRIHVSESNELGVSLDGIDVVFIHKLVGPKLIDEPDAPPLLLKVQQYAGAFFGNELEGAMELPPGV